MKEDNQAQTGRIGLHKLYQRLHVGMFPGNKEAQKRGVCLGVRILGIVTLVSDEGIGS